MSDKKYIELEETENYKVGDTVNRNDVVGFVFSREVITQFDSIRYNYVLGTKNNDGTVSFGIVFFKNIKGNKEN